ncbi:hypothetical protein Tco_0099388 [Tanacetum coccineum]
MDLLSFIQTVDPIKVRVGERQRAEDEPRLLDTTAGRVVPLLPNALARAKSELDASVDKLFDECGNGNQAEQETVVKEAAHVQPRHQRKRKTIVYDAGGPSYPPKKLRGDHGTLSGASIGGKSMSSVQRLLARAVQNAEVRGEPIPTLPFVTSSVSATLEHEDEAHTAFATQDLTFELHRCSTKVHLSLQISSHHFGANIAKQIRKKFVESSVFGGDSSGGGVDHTAGGFPDLTGSDFIVGDDGGTCREMVDEFTPPKFFALIRGMEHDQLFTEFNVGVARQMSLSAEVRMRAEYNIRERRRLNSVVEEKNSLLKARDEEVKSLKAQLLVKEAEAAEVVHLRAEASKFEVVEEYLCDEVKVLKEQNAALEQEKTDMCVKVADLAASVKVREQEVADLDAQVTFAKSQSDNFADRVHELEASSAGLREKVTAYEGFID